jgi:hypothetical protein
MSLARLLVSRVALSFFIVLFALAAFFFASFKFGPTAKACPQDLPVSLRELYMRSDRVVVATVSGSVISNVESETEAWKFISIRTALNVSQTLKGEKPEPIVYLTRHGSISNQMMQQGETEEKTFGNGKRLLLFLSKLNDTSDYALTDYRHAAKDLSDTDLDVYVKRVEELARILKEKNPDKKQIVEWLVRCAEEPATRWEGAYDLAQNFSIMLYLNDEKNKKSESSAPQSEETEEQTSAVPVSSAQSLTPVEAETKNSTETSNNNETDQTLQEQDKAEDSLEPSIAFRIGFYPPYDAEFARLLTKEQKDRLSNALFQDEEIDAGDEKLIELVKNWEGIRVVRFLLPQLRKLNSKNSYKAEQMMGQITDVLDNKELSEVFEMYAIVSYMDDDEIIDESDLKPEDDGETDTDASEEAENEIQNSDETESSEETADEQPKSGPTAAQKRDELIERFISICESALAQKP